MKRREFIFRSMQASLLLSPVLSIRRAEAQINPRQKVLFFVCCSGYPDPGAFFPGGDENNWNLSPILSQLGGIKDHMIVIDGLDIRSTGLNPSGANHARSVAKILTAKDVLEPSPGNEDEGELGDISIDQYIARELGVRSLNLGVDDRYRLDLRGHPFATGPRRHVRPIFETVEAWDNVFRDFSPPDQSRPQAEFEARMKRLRGKKSILDGILDDLKNFRREMSGIEKLKLDIHEESIRSTENLVRRDLEEQPPRPSAACNIPGRDNSGTYIPNRINVQMNLFYNAFSCERIGVGGYMFGTSGYHWNYSWVPNFGTIDSIHNIVHHDAGNERDRYIRSSGWDWSQIAALAERMRNTPDGNGNLLDNTLIVAMSLFGHHHEINRIPVVLFGNAQGRLRTNRLVQAGGQFHDKLLT
ncbi:MAG: DUF1552 domain-containing protein, partial [Bdellovibrionia bacterium]